MKGAVKRRRVISCIPPLSVVVAEWLALPTSGPFGDKSLDLSDYFRHKFVVSFFYQDSGKN